MAHPLVNVDSWRGPTASQAAGLTLAAARAVVTSQTFYSQGWLV